jgi:hypothetical protein
MDPLDMILFRASPETGAYFGRGSYWTPSLACALHFREWAERLPLHPRKGLVIWRVDFEEPDQSVLDLRPPFVFVNSMRVNEHVEELARLGMRWIVFYEGGWKDIVFESAVYLGADDLSARVKRHL